MPQLDPVPFASIYLWFLNTFFISYLIFLKAFLPKVGQWMKIQNKEQAFLIYWLFIYHAMYFRREYRMQEFLAVSTNISLCVELLLGFIATFHKEIRNIVVCSTYEINSFYIIRRWLA